jgi:hypothetical protein
MLRQPLLYGGQPEQVEQQALAAQKLERVAVGLLQAFVVKQA